MKHKYIDEEFREAATFPGWKLALLTLTMAAMAGEMGWGSMKFWPGADPQPMGSVFSIGIACVSGLIGLVGAYILLLCLGGWYLKIRPGTKVANKAQPSAAAPVSHAH